MSTWVLFPSSSLVGHVTEDRPASVWFNMCFSGVNSLVKNGPLDLWAQCDFGQIP